MNQFRVSQDSILGAVSDEDRGKGWVEWGEEKHDESQDDNEDDDYPESHIVEFDWND